MNDKQPPRYASFLLRLWQVKDKESWTWRASLESPASASVRGFSNPQSLFAFLQEFLEKGDPPQEKVDNGTSPGEEEAK